MKDNNKIEELRKTERTQNGGYTVPDAYFSDLQARIMTRIEQQQEPEAGFWSIFKRAVVFSLSFGCLVVLALTGYYFTGYQARNNEIEADEFALIDMYNVSTDDIVEMVDTQEESSVLFAEAAIEYLDTYGYGMIADEYLDNIK